MAAYLKFPTEKEWEVLSRFLDNEGCIIISPSAAIQLSNEFGSNWTDFAQQYEDRLIDYDFGGEPDILVDIAYEGTFAYGSVESELAILAEEVSEQS